MTTALAALGRRMGIQAAYRDLSGATHETPPETQRALLFAMGLDVPTEAAAEQHKQSVETRDLSRLLPSWVVCEADSRPTLDIPAAADWTLTREDGTEISGRGGDMLPKLPLGRHRLTLGAHDTWLLCAPPILPLPPRCWGLAAPLYGLRAPQVGGIGTYRDLGLLAKGLGRAGAAFLGINPVHAGFPTDATAFSPYAPSHRGRLNVLHIDTGGASAETGRLIDYARAIPHKMEALRQAFAARTDDPGFDRFASREGAPLQIFALHQALSEQLGPFWPDWPIASRDPATAMAAHADAVRDETLFHTWLQYKAECQLAEAAEAARSGGMGIGLYLDLAVGTHPAGAETWEDPTRYARGVSLGAPPDAFSPEGQTWGLAPMVPHVMEADGFAALAQTLARQMQFGGLLRIDHILGFERAFWVPETGEAGAYVAMPRAAMLAVARIEAARAGATIVGEDLGNVPDGLREELAVSGILGCRVAMFEHGDTQGFRDPKTYGERTIASFGTHDLPTWIGWRASADIAARQNLGHVGADAADTMRSQRDRQVGDFDAATGDTSGRAPAMFEFLASADSRLVCLQAEDILGQKDQPNLPGTIHEYPNWRRRLGPGPEDLARDATIGATAAIMKRHGR